MYVDLNERFMPDFSFLCSLPYPEMPGLFALECRVGDYPCWVPLMTLVAALAYSRCRYPMLVFLLV